MGNSSSSTSGAAAITVAAVAAAATAAWVFSSYLSSEIMEPQNRSSETKESQNRSSETKESQNRSSETKESQNRSSETKESQNRSSETKESQNRFSETTQDLNCLHVEDNFGASPIYDPETKASLSGNEVHVDQHIIHGSEFHPTTYTQLDHIQTSKVKDVRHNFKSNEGCKQKEEVVDQNSWKSKAKQKLKSKAHSASLVTGVQAESSQIGSKKLKRKRKLKADSNTQLLRHLTSYVHHQGNEVRVDQHIIHGSEIHPTTYTQLDHIQASKVKDVRHNFKSKESCKQKEVNDRSSWKSKAKQKLKADAIKQIPKHLTPNSYQPIKNSERHSKRQCDKSNEDTEVFSCMMRSASHITEREFALLEARLASLMAGVQDCQIGSKKVTPLSLTQYKTQKHMQLDDQNFQKLKWKRKLKADVNNQIPRHLTPSIHLQETIKIMSYNIWSIKYYKRDKRMNAVSHLIEQHSPDIILLQEVTPEIYIYFQSCTWWGIYKCSVKGEQATKQCFCMMLSKLPVGKFFYKHFVNTKTCKGISAAKFTSKSNKMLAVATCHLKSPDGPCTYDIERASQAKEAIDLLKFSPNVVLGGDMNWDELTDGPFPLTSGWRDAWSNLKPKKHGYTYDTESNAMLKNRRCVVQKRLDRFVCRLKDFDMIDIKIVGTEAIKGVSYKSNGQKLPVLPSDHYGLILTICAK